MRALGITFISLALTTAVIGNAYYRKKQFYPSVVYITKSNPSMAVIYIQAFILVYLMGKLMRKVFFGELRAAEFEHLMERSWYAITETCLAFTLFRDDFTPKFVALFTVLLFLKSFHWLAEDRVDFMERSPVISWIFHARVSALLIILVALDVLFICHAYQSTITKGASVQLVFGFEYAILTTIIFNIAIKYVLHTVDLNSENPWESKTVFLLYTEVVMGFIRVFLYVTFVGIMVRLYTLPLFAFRPMYYTIRKFKQACNDVILSRRAIQNMNTLYPDATPEELAAADNVCIICREEMTTASKKLPCNHIFHTSCLRSWFQRQQTCPTCRLNILHTTTPRPAAPPPQQPQPGFPFQGLNGAVFGQPPMPPQPQPQVFPQFGAPGNFPFWQQAPPAPPQMPQQQQQQPQQQGTSNEGNPTVLPNEGEENNNGDSEPRQSPQMPPFGTLPPFFCPPFFGIFPPPPMPPSNFSGLSDEDLRRMEGDARESIEARLQCLRQIELLLDASVTVMQQYMTTVTATNINSARRIPRPSDSASQESTSNNDSNVPKPTVSSNKSPPLSSPSTSTTSATETVVGTNAEAATSSSSQSNDRLKDEDPLSSEEQKEIRRLRLQKFDNDANQANQAN
ncbi:hypothetical protein RUM44_001336 [Polyplax serrata]|uniref:RING-type E3 ubiquitin transferase n=1 Tax=Polyplax serrata TaxID=468196 RepID=A0ABR1AJZ8_POLSC